MRFRILVLVAVVFLFSGGPGSAENHHLKLDDAITLALADGPGLKAAESSAEAAAREAKASGRRRWGALDAVASYQLYQDDQMVRPISRQLLAEGFAGLPFDDEQWHYGVVAEVPLYLGGKLASSVEVAKISAEKARVLLEGTRWQVRFNVTSLYASAQSLDAVARALDRQIAALESTNSRLELMVSEGERPDVDRLKVVEELEGARADRATVGANRIKVGALLLSLLGKNPTDRVTVDHLPEQLPRLVVDAAELHGEIEGVSTIRQAHLSLNQSEQAVDIATSEFIPKVVARGNYMVNDAPSLDGAEDTWGLSLGVVVPLIHGGARSERRSAAKERRQAAEFALEKARLETQAQLEGGLASFGAALDTVRAAEARVAAGGEAARIEQIRYDTGAGTIEDLLRARAREAGALAAVARARASVLTAAAHVNTIAEKEAVK